MGDCYGERGSNPIAMSVVAIFGIIMLSVCSIWFYNTMFASKTPEQSRRESLKDVKAIKNGSAIAFGLYFLSAIIVILSMIICDPEDMIYGAGSSFSSFAMTFVMLVFSMRLHLTFDKTPFSLSNPFKYYVIFVISTIFILYILFGILFMFSLAEYDVVIVGAGSTMLFLTINSVLLLFLFVKKLNDVIKSFVSQFGTITGPQLDVLNRAVSVDPPDVHGHGGIGGGGNDEKPRNAMSRQVSVDMQQGGFGSDVSKDSYRNMKSLNRLIKDMNRYTILVGIATCSSFLFSFITIIITLTGDQYEFYWVTCGLFFDACVNCTCLAMQFEFAKHRYYTTCGPIHRCCEDRYANRANKENGSVLLKRLESGEMGIQTNNSGGKRPDSPDFAEDRLDAVTEENIGGNGDGNGDDDFVPQQQQGGNGMIISMDVGSDGTEERQDENAVIGQSTIALVAKKNCRNAIRLK